MEVQDTNTAAAEGLSIDTGASTDWFVQPTKNELRGITYTDLDLRWEALRDEALLIDPNYFNPPVIPTAPRSTTIVLEIN